MSINIGNYTFDGPYSSTNELENLSGVYAIICQKNDKDYIINIGKSNSVVREMGSNLYRLTWSQISYSRRVMGIWGGIQ